MYLNYSKFSFESINKKSLESQNLVKNYDSIRTVQTVLTNVSMAREWLARVLRLTKETRELKKILREEQRYFDDDKDDDDEDEDNSEDDEEDDDDD